MRFRLFNTLDRYIIRNFITTFLFMLALMILIIVVIDVAEKIDDFIEKKPGLYKIVFDYYFNFIPFIANLLSPICIFLTVIFFTTRLAQRFEIVAMFSSGVSFWRLLFPYLFTAGMFALLSFYLHAFVVPKATSRWMDFEYQYVKNKRLWGKRNIHKKISKDSYLYLYSYNQYDNIGYMVTLENFNGSKMVSKIFASRIQWLDSLKKWRMFDVKIRKFFDKYEKLVFLRQTDTVLPVTTGDIFQRENLAESLPLNELYDYIELEKQRGSDILHELITEKYERFAYPFATIVLTIIGFSVSTRRSRGGVAVQIGTGLVISFLYIVMLNVAQLLFTENFPPWFSVWFANFMFLVIGILLLFRAPK